MALAAIAKVPELNLSEDESKRLADGITRVTELYDVPMVDEKTRAWMRLGGICATIYGPRVIAMKLNRSNKRAVQPVQVMQPRTGAV